MFLVSFFPVVVVLTINVVTFLQKEVDMYETVAPYFFPLKPLENSQNNNYMEDSQREDHQPLSPIVQQESSSSQNDVMQDNSQSNVIDDDQNHTKALPISPSIVGWIEPSTLSGKRALYACGSDYVELSDLVLYADYAKKNSLVQPSLQDIKKIFNTYHVKNFPILSAINHDHDAIKNGYYSYNSEINSKISFFRGDVSQLEIDAVVNAANESLLGGGGIDGGMLNFKTIII